MGSREDHEFSLGWIGDLRHPSRNIKCMVGLQGQTSERSGVEMDLGVIGL